MRCRSKIQFQQEVVVCMESLLLKDYDKEYLELSWKWLNEPEIRELTNTPSFTLEQQLRWFENLPNTKSTYLIWGIEYNSQKIGACGLKNITENDCEYWGYIGEKSHWGHGIGKAIMILMENEAVNKKLDSIWLKVLNINTRALTLYKKCGYLISKDNGVETIMRKKL